MKIKRHGNTVVEVVPCAIHPLHQMRVLASGGRRGCPMCEAQIELLCRSTGASLANEAP